MVKYKITIKKTALKELDDIPKKDLQKVIKRILALVEDPRPYGSQKLSGQNYFRIRQGDYRIVYFINDKDWVINIVKIGHRREVY